MTSLCVLHIPTSQHFTHWEYLGKLLLLIQEKKRLQSLLEHQLNDYFNSPLNNLLSSPLSPSPSSSFSLTPNIFPLYIPIPSLLPLTKTFHILIHYSPFNSTISHLIHPFFSHPFYTHSKLIPLTLPLLQQIWTLSLHQLHLHRPAPRAIGEPKRREHDHRQEHPAPLYTDRSPPLQHS